MSDKKYNQNVYYHQYLDAKGNKQIRKFKTKERFEQWKASNK